jgi:hypothetical protein
MSDGRETEITRRMDALRSQGTRVAAQFPRDLDRARDWREHVRAHPIPAVLAAAAVGFAVIPGRRYAQPGHPPAVSTAPAGVAVPANEAAADSRKASQRKPGFFSNPIAGAVGAWAGRWALATATSTLQRLASEHLQSFPTSFTKHGSAPSQRRSDTAEQRRAYSQ